MVVVVVAVQKRGENVLESGEGESGRKGRGKRDEGKNQINRAGWGFLSSRLRSDGEGPTIYGKG